MNCPQCQNESRVKNGKAHGDQRYKCKKCGCNYTKSYKRGHPFKDKLLAVILHISGMSMNSISPIIGVTTQSIMRWIAAFAQGVEKPAFPTRPVEVELDEMHHFLLKKMRHYGSGKCSIMEIPNSWGGFVGIVVQKPESK